MKVEHEIGVQLAALGEESGNNPAEWRELVPLLYDELRAIARRQLRAERDSHTLNTTGLVHETYLRLVMQRVECTDRAQFFAIAARLMRRVLIDYARHHRAAKRGGPDRTLTLDGDDQAPDVQPAVADERAELLVALDEALERLAAIDPRLAQVVECRFFGGLSEEETAEALGVTARTVRRDWVKAKDWLRHAVET